MTAAPHHTEREFVCFNCGQYWTVYEIYELHNPDEPADICPECGKVGHLNATRILDHDASKLLK